MKIILLSHYKKPYSLSAKKPAVKSQFSNIQFWIFNSTEHYLIQETKYIIDTIAQDLKN